MKYLTLREIQLNEMDALCLLYEVCEKNGLRLYISGGTLLGAVRHKGFIPWDDDVDVCMPRSDYNELIGLSKKAKLFGSRYELLSYEEGNLKLPFAKLVDKRVRIEQEYDSSSKFLWIDIIPVDGYPENDDDSLHLLNRVEFYRQLLRLNFLDKSIWRSRKKRIIASIVRPFAKLYGVDRCNRKIEEIAKSNSYEDSQYVGAITWGLHGLGEKMEKEKFENIEYVEFEGHKLKTMSCYKEYLEKSYSNYMVIPPAEKRENHTMKAWIAEEIIV